MLSGSWCQKNQEGKGVMNSSPKQKPLFERTMAGMRECTGVSNSISRRSPGLSRMPAYRVMPPSLISVPRPSTTVVEKPFDVTTRTGRSTGRRSQRRGLLESVIVAHHYLCAHRTANYQSEGSSLLGRDAKTWRSHGCK